MKLNNLVPANNRVNWFNHCEMPEVGQYARAESVDRDLEQWFTAGMIYQVVADSKGNILKDSLTPDQIKSILEFPLWQDLTACYVLCDNGEIMLINTLFYGSDYFTFHKYGA